VADGDSVAVRYTLRATQLGDFGDVPPSGKPVVAQSIAFYRLADGKIVEERAQLGHVVRPPADRRHPWHRVARTL
jgi:predicted ester cyclase